MITAAIDDDDDRRLEQRRRARRTTALGELPPKLLLALAGAPFWTPPALAAAGLDADRLAAAGSLVQREGCDEDETIALEREAVEDAVRYLYARPDLSPVEVLADFGERLGTRDDTPPVLAQWARLARSLRKGPGDAAKELLVRVHALCEGNALGEASEVLEAAGALARTLGGPFAVAEQIARHRIEREFRGVRDRRHLSFFVGRNDAMAAFRRLLDDAGPWALHYVGVGGAGKTTFIRHLAVEQAAARGMSVAQIDFDYLSPAYPGRDPGQLVQAIVHELKIFIERPEQEHWLRSILEQVDRLRDVAEEVRAEDPIGPIAWPEFQELLGFVSSYLESFPRPLIILDTCEELMKLSPIGSTIPSVEATFRLIEELHARVPRLRVIFAGRRLLTAGGDGWTASPQAQLQPLSAPRAYLMLHELRGMTPDEAGEVLDRILPESRKDDLRLRKAILDACPEDGRVNAIVVPEADPAADVPRFSPYRVVRLGRWVAAEPTLPADRLEQGGDPYVEQRIVQRIGALEGLLPILVLLRRFDARMLARVRGEPEEDARVTIDELAGHEWIYAHDAPQRGIVVEVKASIRDQLERYLETHRGVELRDAREAIGRALAPALQDDDAVLNPPELIDAALRATAGVTAARAWFALEAKIGEDWGSALTLTRFLLGEGNAAEDGATILGCAVRATHISALIHEHPELDVADQWRQIAVAMAKLEQIAIVRMLRARAHLGVIAADGWRAAASPEALSGELVELMTLMGPRLPAFVTPWVIAAVEGLLECLERSLVAAPGLQRVTEPEWWASLPLSPGLEAWIAVLRARASALLGEPRAVGDALLQALMARDLALPATCCDWLPPASLRDRIRVEAMRLHYFSGSADGVSGAHLAHLADQRGPLAAWCDDLEAEALTDDGDRLLSGFLQYEAGVAGKLSPATAGKLALARKVKRSAWGLREPAVYRRFPPAAVTYALLTWDAAPAPAELGATDAVRIRTARARRTRDPALLAAETTQTASFRLLVEMGQAAALVLERSAPLPPKLRAASDVIDHWSYQRAITNAELVAAVDSMRPHVDEIAALVREGEPLLAARALATLEQVTALARYTSEPIAVIPRRPEHAPAHPDQVESVIRLGLQEAAAQAPFRLPRSVEALDQAMPGAIARLAIEEAELLSLRFPDRAARLFEHAAQALERLSCPVEAQVARLGWAACQQMLGSPTVEPIAPVVPALAHFAARVNGTATRFPVLERARARRPSIRRIAKAWTRRYADELLFALGLGFGAILIVMAWLVLDRMLLPLLRGYDIAIPESPLSTAVAFLLGAAALFLFRAKNLQALRASRIWRKLQVIRPWRYRLGLAVRDDREGLRIVVRRREGEQEWLVPKPGAGDIPTLAKDPTDLAALAALRGEITRQLPLPVVARADIARTAGAAAWEAPLVAGLPNLVVWRAIRRSTTAAAGPGDEPRGGEAGRRAMTPQAPTFVEAQIAGAWLEGCEVTDLAEIQGIAHLVGRPRRLVGSIDLERARPGDRTALPGRAELADRLFDDLDVVLQLAPQDFDQASAATRTELGLMRELAGGLIERGARSVLVIPAIAHDHVESVVTEVARALGAGPERKLRRLVEAARRCRAAIAGISFADHAIVANEIALFVAVTDSTSE